MSRQVRCFLLKRGRVPGNALGPGVLGRSQAYVEVDGAWQETEVSEALGADSQPGTVIAVAYSSMSSPPWWQTLVAGELELDGFATDNRPTRGAAIFVRAENPAPPGHRWIMWTFGSVSSGISHLALEPRFGVITALNRIGPEARLRKLQYRQTGAFRQRTGHIAATDTPLTGFRMDTARDLLSAAGGLDPGRDTQLFGSDGLSYRADVTQLADLVAESRTVLSDFNGDGYKEAFAFIDDYIEVDEPEVVAALDAVVGAAITAASHQIDIALPLDIGDFNDDREPEFVLLPGERGGRHGRRVLTVEALTHYFGAAPDLSANLRFLDGAGDLLGSAEVRECIATDLTLDGDHYALSDGTYFLVDRSFLAAVDQSVASIPIWSIALPPYEGGTEGDWLEEAGANPGFVLLDQTFLRLEGRTPVETADLVHSSGALVYAKRKGRSSDMSYLFAQAVAACQLLSDSAEACAQIRHHVQEVGGESAEAALDALGALDLLRSEIPVVIALLGNWRGRNATALPLIAKLELRTHIRTIEQQGFKPYLALVDTPPPPASATASQSYSE